MFLSLGVIGVLLPVLPSTPFVLLAAWCFAQSSEKWHAKLLDSKLFGPMIRNWETNRCIALRTKIVGLTAMTIAGGASLVFAIDTHRLSNRVHQRLIVEWLANDRNGTRIAGLFCQWVVDMSRDNDNW